MGMYTEFNIGVALKEDTPKNVIDMLKFMSGEDYDDYCPCIPNHPFFETYRWRMLFICDSYYFDGKTQSTFEYDNIDERWHLTVRSNLKNYDREIKKFLDWIKPYLDTSGFLGYMWYEEDDAPTLIFNNTREGYIEIAPILYESIDRIRVEV